MTPESNCDADVEAGMALAVAPFMREIAEMVRAKLPPGTDFGILIGVPSGNPKEEGRVLAVTTDRTRMAYYAGRWILNVLPRAKGPTGPKGPKP